MTVQDWGPSFPNQGNSRAVSFYRAGSFDSATEVYDLGLHYMQQNGNTGDVFIGGETDGINGILTSDDSEISASSLRTLQSMLSTEFGAETWKGGQGPTVKSKWSGIMGFTTDGVPLVGRLPEDATGRREGGEWIAAGFNGYGMGNCWLSGEALAGMMRGEDVSGWLPECYRPDVERLQSLRSNKAAPSLFARQ